jgi:hypothetical protein
MVIQSVTSALAFQYTSVVAAAQEPVVEEPVEAVAEGPVTALEEQEAEDAVPQDEPDEPRGVLRHLMNDHFKGVAAVRLRINFHEELEAMKIDATKAAVQEQAAAVTDVVGSELLSLGEVQALDEIQLVQVSEFQATFVLAIGETTDAFAAAETPAVDDLAGGFRSAFNALAGALEGLLTPEPAPEPTVADPVAPEEIVEVETPDVVETEEPAAEPEVSPLAALRDAFEGVMAQLHEALTAELLPPLPAPTGNGAAYEKFLAIYQDMTAPPVAEPDGTETVQPTDPIDIEA